MNSLDWVLITALAAVTVGGVWVGIRFSKRETGPGPSRRGQRDVIPIADLDAIIGADKAFKLAGKWRIIKNLNLQEFLVYLTKVAEFYNLQEDKSLPEGKRNQIIQDKCYDIFSSVSDDITKEETGRMSIQQALSLFTLIRRTVTGDLMDLDETQKKSLLNYPGWPKEWKIPA